MLLIVHGKKSLITNEPFELLVQRLKSFVADILSKNSPSIIETSTSIKVTDPNGNFTVTIDDATDYFSIKADLHPNAYLRTQSFGPLANADFGNLMDLCAKNYRQLSYFTQDLFVFIDGGQYLDDLAEVVLGKTVFLKKKIEENLSKTVADIVYECEMYGSEDSFEKFAGRRTVLNNPVATLLPVIEEMEPGFTEALRKKHEAAALKKRYYHEQQINLNLDRLNRFGENQIDLILGNDQIDRLIQALFEHVYSVGGYEEVLKGIFNVTHRRKFEEYYTLRTSEKHEHLVEVAS